MKQLQLTIFSGLSILFAVAGPLHAGAEEAGVSSDTILFGQAAALEGPSSALGQGMRQGILAAFMEINAKGGVHGRKLKLVSRDDGYDPDRSVAQTTKLIEEDKVFALIGAVGTPTAVATIPISSARNVPVIGPFTGAEFLRAPELHNVVNIRASYRAEAEAWIKHLTEDLGFKDIAIFYQDDSFGRDGLAGVKLALEKRGMELTAEGTFERNTRAIGSALRTIKRAEPEAVVMVGTYGPCAEFIKLAHKSGFDPIFVNISFVGCQRAGQRAWPGGPGRRCLPGRPLSLGYLREGGRRLPGRRKGARSEHEAGICISGGLSLRTPCCRRAGEHRTESDTRGYASGYQRRRKFRHQRNDHDFRVEDARRSQQGLSHGDPARRNFQGS